MANKNHLLFSRIRIDIERRIKILHLETATKVCSIAISENGKALGHKTVVESNMHTKLINVLIEELLKEQNLRFTDLSAICVSNGPGSYTGLRVGFSTAKGLAFALDLPLITVSTLQALSAPYKGNKAGKNILAALDARRNEVYMAVFNPDLEYITEDCCFIIEEGSFPLNWPKADNLIICGNAADKIKVLTGDQLPDYQLINCEAQGQADLAYHKYLAQEYEDLDYVKPNYLKPPNITKSKKKPF